MKHNLSLAQPYRKIKDLTLIALKDQKLTYIVPFIKMVTCDEWRVTRETLPVTCH